MSALLRSQLVDLAKRTTALGQKQSLARVGLRAARLEGTDILKVSWELGAVTDKGPASFETYNNKLPAETAECGLGPG